jgi:tetratricopeptide (TPR) repeat protein
MKKYLLTITLLFVFYSQTFSQYNEARRIDSLRLDSLKKNLPLLKDSARVDVLNEIAIRFGYFDRGGGFAHKDDSIRFYSSKAYEEASKIGYKKGMAMGLISLSGFESWMNKPLTDTAKKRENILKSIHLAEQINNDEVLGWGYYYLHGLTFAKTDFTNHENIEKYYRKSIGYFLQAGDTLHAAELYNWLCGDYSMTGEYEKAYDYGKKSVDLSKRSSTYISQTWHEFLVQFALTDMADIYTAAGDYESAMACLIEANQYGLVHKTGWLMLGNIADLFYEMKQYDSAFVYWNKWRDGKIFWNGTGLGYAAWANSLRGKIYLANKEYDKAIEIFRSCNDTLQKYPRPGYPVPMGYLLLLGQAYYGKENYETALECLKQATVIARQNNQRPEMMKCYELLSSLYHKLGNNDSAYEYLTKYNTIKDSVQSKQFLLRIYNSKKDAEDAKKESRIGLLNKDNKIKEQQLKQQATFRNFLIAVFIAMVFAGLYVFRNINLKQKNERLTQEQKEQGWKLKELESENKHVELQKQSAELEMQALRAQMNPHFIFNCLSSINRFILKNESKTASNYLTRFSRLIRMVLINSQRPLVALEEELQMLRLYLDMERLRFKDSFDYSITFLNTIESDNIFIPPLLLQPFCENAIWHGLMQKEDQGRLDIELSMQNNILNCTITDNGIGRERAEEMKSKSAEKEKSMGLKITTERLALLNKERGVHTFYDITDLKDENGKATGTKVTLKISFKESVEEIVLK